MIGRRVSHYRIVSELGAGGMGVVYRAQDERLDRPVAVKFIAPHLISDAAARLRFVREAKAAASLGHEGICTVHEIGEADGRLFIVMEMLEGQALKDRLAAGPLPLLQAVDLGSQIANALQEAHDRGVIHRDIKPANIMLTPRGRAKILDFGLVQLGGATLLTQASTTLGTAAYMSPEQVRGGAVDHRTDLWSLGVVLYEMAAGRRPFLADHPQALMYAIQHQEPPPLSASRPDAEPWLEKVISTCLAKDPESRYPSARALELALSSGGLSGGPNRRGAKVANARIEPPLAGGRRRGKRAAAVWLGALLLLAAMLGIGWRNLGNRALRPHVRQAIQGVAVLPFANMSGDDGQSHVVDGMHEALITDLSRHSRLKVISRTSVLRYRAGVDPLPKIAAELNVDAIIEGSVMREGNRMRISAHLVDAATDRQIWAQSYERHVTEVLQLQREVAEAIVAEVGASLASDASPPGVETIVVEPEAFEAYSLGRHHLAQRTTSGMREAVAQFRRAIQLAPGFAEAHAGLADAHAVAGVNGIFPPHDSYPVAREEAARALALDGALAQAHVSLAFVQLYYDWDRVAADRSYRAALKLDPNNAFARQWYAIFQEQEGRFAEALAEIERARMLDPMSPIMNANVARRFAMARRYEEALHAAERALQLDPKMPFANSVLAEIHFLRQDHEQEAAALTRLIALSDPGNTVGQGLIDALERGGRRGFYAARLLLSRDRSRPDMRFHAGLIEASCLAQLGDMDEAFAVIGGWLENRESSAQWVKIYPLLDPLRTDPRYRWVLGRIGLSP